MPKKPATELEDRQACAQLDDSGHGDLPGCRMATGTITSIGENGRVLVDFAGNPAGPLIARTTVKVESADARKNVVLAFENGDPRLPIILGVIQDGPIAVPETEVHLERRSVEDIRIDGRDLVLEAARRVEIRCGRSMLIMQNDGKIVIKGRHLVSRASQVNKIKGAAVKIN